MCCSCLIVLGAERIPSPASIFSFHPLFPHLHLVEPAMRSVALKPLTHPRCPQSFFLFLLCNGVYVALMLSQAALPGINPPPLLQRSLCPFPGELRGSPGAGGDKDRAGWPKPYDLAGLPSPHARQHIQILWHRSPVSSPVPCVPFTWICRLGVF